MARNRAHRCCYDRHGQDTAASQMRDQSFAEICLAIHLHNFDFRGEGRSQPGGKKNAMDSQISPGAFSLFFAWAPVVLGVAIYAIFYVAKRREGHATGTPIGQTFNCAQCGRRESREHMVPEERNGQINWYCDRCSHVAATAH